VKSVRSSVNKEGNSVSPEKSQRGILGSKRGTEEKLRGGRRKLKSKEGGQEEKNGFGPGTTQN